MGILHLVKRIFLAIGIVILLLYLVFFLTLTYQSMREPVVDFDDGDVQYVLKWLWQQGDPTQLLHSHHPTASWAGEFEKMFALQLDRALAQEVASRLGVVRGDQLPEDLQEAVLFAVFFTRELTWFPVEEKILTDDYYVSPIRIVTQDGYPDAVYLMVIHPERRILYFVAARM